MPSPRPALTDDDRSLVEEFLATRSEQAFRRLYRQHASAVYALLLRLTAGDAARAEDCLQDAWLRAIAGLDRFAWRSTLRTWLRGIAINCWREGWREDRRAPLRLVDGDEPPADLPEVSPLDVIALERAVAALPDGYRAVLVLHDVEGFTHEEIAEALGIVPGTSKSQLARARAAVRRSLA
jgi:RNA polymerase sigma-70 factor (ECF subfamily)